MQILAHRLHLITIKFMAIGSVRTSGKMKKTFRDNSLSIVLILIIIGTVIGHSISGMIALNRELQEAGLQTLTYGGYLLNGHFIGTFFENWESEFLQMGLYVVLTISLFQKGSSESKDPDSKDPVDREPDKRRKNVPAAVKKGGIILELYKNSLSYVYLILFIASFFLHAYGGAEKYNQEQMFRGSAERVSMMQFMGSAEFWYESFQNWQSEFVAVLSIVVLSIYFRQKGSPESKPVDAPHSETGSA